MPYSNTYGYFRQREARPSEIRTHQGMTYKATPTNGIYNAQNLQRRIILGSYTHLSHR